MQRVADAHDWQVTITESEAGGARFEFARGGYGPERHRRQRTFVTYV
ncbi:hypothetical protein C488_04567 [Natrinema pellirubrum DSM 15624]|uniref:Uncharacterized protein n=1 Tax=Natrinema pellirubrum (strain DSM 15624 / CIP 106293 / JCM 10476 / NCIMB 786 / 157) TaxID=797303 RepID=L9Z2K2_NATP1|nr:hypothetical protein [Natrinema pellirubrum]ELY79393.1 hypothetical protein C488_04567 [Natrinema pellirubrum DSM 15624]